MVQNAAETLSTALRAADPVDDDWEAALVPPLRLLVQERLPLLSKAWAPSVCTCVSALLCFIVLQAPVTIVDRSPLIIGAVVCALIVMGMALLPGALVTSACQSIQKTLNDMRVTAPEDAEDARMVGAAVAERIAVVEAYLKEQNKGLGPGFVVFGRVTSAGTLAKVGAQACGGAVATVLFLAELYKLTAADGAGSSA